MSAPTFGDARDTATPLIGRRLELNWLRNRHALAARGYAHLVLVEGDAGIGKSRLVQEFLGEVRQRGTTVVRGRCYEHLDLAYLPHPAEIAERLDVVTTDFAYLRLIGDRAAVEAKTRVFDRTVLDQAPRLARHATLIRGLLARDIEVHAFANNHYAGYAPETIEALAQAVRGDVLH